MAIRYDLSAVDILKIFGFDKPVGTKFIENIEEKYNMKLPEVYRNFMQFAYGSPLLETSDIYVGNADSKPYMLKSYYDVLEGCIEKAKEEWASDPKSKKGKLYTLSKLDKELWSTKVKNYLLIGTDYATGSIMPGIPIDDMQNDDPPVYWSFDDNSCERWRVLYPKLSTFLEGQFAAALCGMDYGTAEEALEDFGWKYEEVYGYDEVTGEIGTTKSLLKKCRISIGKMKKYKTISQNKVFYCFDDEKNIVYAGYLEEDELSLSAIHHSDEDDIFKNN